MADGPKTYTAAGNVRAPSKALCLQWVSECWEALSVETIKESFRVCGISASTDRTEDGELCCLKTGTVAAEAREPLRQETATLLSALEAGDQHDDNADSFTDMEEDEDELDDNEVMLDNCQTIKSTNCSPSPTRAHWMYLFNILDCMHASNSCKSMQPRCSLCTQAEQ